MRQSLLFLLLASTLLSAWVLTPEDLASQAARTREAQLRELYEASQPEYDSYLGLGWMFLPKPDESKLETGYGTMNGFAFRHRFALYLQNPLDSSDLRIGLGWWAERQGWEPEDFLFFPNYSDWGAVRDIQTFVMTLANEKQAWRLATGLQWQNPESVGIPVQSAEKDSLWWFGQAGWNVLGVQAEFHRTDLDLIRATAEFESRALRGGDTTGPSIYYPDLEILYQRSLDDPLRLTWRQDLWKQKIYVETAWWPSESNEGSGVLHLYADASHLVGAEFGIRRNAAGHYLFGGGFELPFVRLACNLPSDYNQFFHSHGPLVLLEFHLSLQSIKDKAFFNLNAPRAAPMKTEKVHDESIRKPQSIQNQGNTANKESS
ncbi:MAG TPA: hypothetical protein VLM37_12230, partial [Fibrobacteraceae bacterium]|nr:hypothetical protein [Fibrobacteraceae bacterium]